MKTGNMDSHAALCISSETHDARRTENAFSRIKQYAAPHRRRLLVVEDNSGEQLSIRALLGRYRN